MSSKLTLSIDREVIEYAKKYAKDNYISLSKMIEMYLRSLLEKSSLEKTKISPITKELSNLHRKKISKKNDKELLVEALNNRYS